MNILNFIKSIGRKYALAGKEKDSSKTGIIPLERIRTAAVFLDADVPGSVNRVKQIYDYFNKKGISATVFAISLGQQFFSEGMLKAVFIHKENLSWCDCPKQGRRHPSLNVGEDLFISLLPVDSFPVEYAARCSGAQFKVGRKQLPGDVYDLVISEPAGVHVNQIQAFDNIMKFIEIIQA